MAAIKTYGTKVEPKVQAWYVFWYACLSSHDIFKLNLKNSFMFVPYGNHLRKALLNNITTYYTGQPRSLWRAAMLTPVIRASSPARAGII